eukprot:TRINITY_DN2359_c0_g1_i2.p1 TRINITY_DN2359_c0_g1~~TRINITY_DN2359_c0_g1_i2.p1  ORF type:complete len:112 (+),score=25.22 TRINITY_DN2359_c0_g1_i2:91-426(+)
MPKGKQPVRLYVKATVLGYRRSLVDQYPQWSLLKLEGVNQKADTEFYLGKRVAYVYRATKKDKSGSNIRVVWGRIAKAHGTSGVVRARFRKNLPPQSFGNQARVMLYPSRV